ncbi:MAG: enoyl-CoA hydratase/isomerase family protein, partial [Halioglobus sp.]
VSYDIEDQVGVITLNNPPLNLLSQQVTDELLELVSEVEINLPRSLLIRAEGKAFCGGADVSRFTGMTPEQIGSELKDFLAIIQRIERLPIPTIAAVQGACAGGGLEIVLAFDLIFAGRGAKFAQSEAVIGAIPFAGVAQRLAERANPAKAKEIYYHTGFFPAENFEHWGIINKLFDDDALNTASLKEASRLAKGPTQAYAYTKQIVNSYAEKGKENADALTLKFGVNVFETNDFNNGVASLLKDGPGKATFEGK